MGSKSGETGRQGGQRPPARRARGRDWCFVARGAHMFETLSDRLSGILDKLTRRGSLTDSDVSEAMREVRRALLEADVALEVVREFTDKVKAKAVGQAVVKSVTPGQMVVKIVHDE